jgi:hypothetical protein
MILALKATGVLRGFNAQAEGAILSVGPGLAYCNGEQVPAGWELDYGDRQDGWAFAQVGGLPMYAVLLAVGQIAALRDIRRFAAIAICEGSGEVQIGLGAPSIVQRVATAVRLQDGATGQLYWRPLPGGHAAAHLTEETLTLAVRAEQARETAVLVEYTAL